MQAGKVQSGLGVLGLSIVAILAATTSAFATDGQPTDWGLGLQNSATTIMDQIHDFHTFIFIIITIISLFVLALLIYVMLRYNERANPNPSKNSHNTLLEVAWTVIPILILVAIAVPSFRLLFAQYSFPKAEVTIKATASQWQWSYAYPDHEGLEFDSVMITDEDVLTEELGDDEFEKRYGSLEGLEKTAKMKADANAVWEKRKQPRLLAVDNPIVVPVGKVVHVLVTANVVIHNWAVPAFGSKIDAVPGRIDRAWFKAEKTGTFYGQCSELCGQNHAFMPIMVKVVTESEYNEWLTKAKEEFAAKEDTSPLKSAKHDQGNQIAFRN